MKIRHVKVPYSILDLPISNETKYVLIAILKFRSGRSKTIKVSLRKISETTNLHNRQITKHINILVNEKIIMRKQTKRNGEYSCNIYTLLYDETNFAEIPWDIAYHKELSAKEKIGYCIMKRFSNLNKRNFSSFITKKELAKYLNCSLNHVDKIKRNLKMAGLINFKRNSKRIVLVYEQNLCIKE